MFVSFTIIWGGIIWILLLAHLWEINLWPFLFHQSLCKYMDLYWLNFIIIPERLNVTESILKQES